MNKNKAEKRKSKSDDSYKKSGRVTIKKFRVEMWCDAIEELFYRGGRVLGCDVSTRVNYGCATAHHLYVISRKRTALSGQSITKAYTFNRISITPRVYALHPNISLHHPKDGLPYHKSQFETD